ncbi:MAG: hypothetical protein QM784_15490 [Polyangiaceae bacterium]
MVFSPAAVTTRTAAAALTFACTLSGCGSDSDWLADRPKALSASVANQPLGGAERSQDEVVQAGPVAVSKAASREIARIPVPPRDGPLLAPIAMKVAVLSKPEMGAPVIGSLRIGARVPISQEPVSKQGCPGGIYAVRPLGFVSFG